MVVDDYNIWEKQLWEKYYKVFSDVSYTITDGVINPKEYFNQPFRIMYINREPYDSDMDSYSLNNALHDEIMQGKKVFKKQVKFREQIRRQLALLSLLSDGRLWRMQKEQICEYVECNSNDSFFNECLNKIAYINIKKSNGKNGSNLNDLREYAQRGLKIIKEQISYCSPSIILGGNIVDRVLDTLDVEWGENLYTKKGIINVFQLKVNGNFYPLFDLIHPSAIKLSYVDDVRNYYYFILDALLDIEKRIPSFWNKTKRI